MPQFIPQADTSPSLDDIVQGVLEAAEFTMDEELQGKRIHGWLKRAEKRAEALVERFLKFAAPGDVEAYKEKYQPAHGYNIEQCMGHDIWYTSQGHGVGFWDRGLGDLGDRLTMACPRRELNVWRTANGYLDLE